MVAIIVRKVFEDQDKPGSGPLSYMSTLDKYLLKAFNRLINNYKISRPLVVSFLLNLPDYYTFNSPVKLINIFMLKTKFLLLIFWQNFNIIDNVAHINSNKVQPYSIFEHYYYRSLYFLQLFLYKYYKVVLVVKREQK